MIDFLKRHTRTALQRMILVYMLGLGLIMGLGLWVPACILGGLASIAWISWWVANGEMV
jgi:hypothetical protein